MEIKNILLAGVGGQGLVLTTKLICEAVFREGYDVKSNDVVGLSQRGGKVWGNIRFGKKVHSPNIPEGLGDILVALEPLEGERWSYMVRDGGMIILNTASIPPTPVLMEQVQYPTDIIERLKKKYQVISIDAVEEGRKLGSTKIVNIFLIGVMAKKLKLSKQVWVEVIRENVPPKYLEENIKAFEIGYNWE